MERICKEVTMYSEYMDSKYTGLIVHVQTHTFETDTAQTTPTGEARLWLSADGKLNYADFVTCLISQ